jgi:integrase
LSIADTKPRERLKAGPDYKNLDLVFATGEGQPLIRLNIVQKHFKPILERAGLPATLRLYDLRHSCATLLLAANENPKWLASDSVTLRSLSQWILFARHAGYAAGASDKLEQMLFTKTGTQ